MIERPPGRLKTACSFGRRARQDARAHARSGEKNHARQIREEHRPHAGRAARPSRPARSRVHAQRRLPAAAMAGRCDDPQARAALLQSRAGARSGRGRRMHRIRPGVRGELPALARCARDQQRAHAAFAGQRAHAVSPRALLRRVAGRGLRRIELPRRTESVAQARRVLGRHVAVSRCRRPRALHQAEGRVGRGSAATAARRLLPRQSRVDRGHAGGDPRDRRDLRLGRRARRLGHRSAQQADHRACLAAGSRTDAQGRLARRACVRARRFQPRRLRRPEFVGRALGELRLRRDAVRGMGQEWHRRLGRSARRAVSCGEDFARAGSEP